MISDNKYGKGEAKKVVDKLKIQLIADRAGLLLQREATKRTFNRDISIPVVLNPFDFDATAFNNTYGSMAAERALSPLYNLGVRTCAQKQADELKQSSEAQGTGSRSPLIAAFNVFRRDSSRSPSPVGSTTTSPENSVHRKRSSLKND